MLLHPWDFPGKNTGVSCHFLLQSIFLTEGLNPGLPHCRQTLYCLSHQGSCRFSRLVVKTPPAKEGDLRDSGLIPGSGRSPGEGKGNPLQYSCLENPMDWGAWWATIHGIAKSRTLLSDFCVFCVCDMKDPLEKERVMVQKHGNSQSSKALEKGRRQWKLVFQDWTCLSKRRYQRWSEKMGGNTGHIDMFWSDQEPFDEGERDKWKT